MTNAIHTLPIIDTSVAQKLKLWGGADIIKESYILFEQETAEIVSKINNYQANTNFQSLRSLAHTLKGSAGTLGIERIARVATSIDSKLKENSQYDTKLEVALLNQFFDEYKQNYKIILNI